MKLKLIAKTVVFNTDGQVLLLRRSPTDERRPGEWDFPGGGVDRGEDILAGAARELREEAGLDCPLSSFRLVFAATEPFPPTNQSITRFLCVVRLPREYPVTLSFEHDEYKWVDVATALVDFPHFFFGRGLRYAQEHGLL